MKLLGNRLKLPFIQEKLWKFFFKKVVRDVLRMLLSLRKGSTLLPLGKRRMLPHWLTTPPIVLGLILFNPNVSDLRSLLLLTPLQPLLEKNSLNSQTICYSSSFSIITSNVWLPSVPVPFNLPIYCEDTCTSSDVIPAKGYTPQWLDWTRRWTGRTSVRPVDRRFQSATVCSYAQRKWKTTAITQVCKNTTDSFKNTRVQMTCHGIVTYLVLVG